LDPAVSPPREMLSSTFSALMWSRGLCGAARCPRLVVVSVSRAGPVGIQKQPQPAETQNISSPADGTSHLGGRGFGTDTAGAAADRLPRTTPGGYPLAHKLAARVQAARAEQEACLVSESSR
jgi:hypothetical protein